MGYSSLADGLTAGTTMLSLHGGHLWSTLCYASYVDCVKPLLQSTVLQIGYERRETFGQQLTQSTPVAELATPRAWVGHIR